MLLETVAGNWKRVRATNATDSALPARVPQAAKPSGSGASAAQATSSAVVDLAVLGGGGVAVQNALMLMLFGTGSDNNTLSADVWGWSRLPGDGDPDLELWVPTLLIRLAGTMSSSLPGVGSRKLASTEYLCDTLTATYDTNLAGVSYGIFSPANNLPAHVVLDLKGPQLLEVTFGTGGVATAANGLVRTF